MVYCKTENLVNFKTENSVDYKTKNSVDHTTENLVNFKTENSVDYKTENFHPCLSETPFHSFTNLKLNSLKSNPNLTNNFDVLAENERVSRMATNSEEKSILVVQNLSKCYGDLKAVNSISFAVDR